MKYFSYFAQKIGFEMSNPVCFEMSNPVSWEQEGEAGPVLLTGVPNKWPLGWGHFLPQD